MFLFPHNLLLLCVFYPIVISNLRRFCIFRSDTMLICVDVFVFTLYILF